MKTLKRLLAVLLLAVVIGGCGLGVALKDFAGVNPNLTSLPKDENGDGVPETYVVVTNSGAPVMDPDTGEQMEVPGARASLAAAAATDTGMADLLMTIGLLAGVPGAGLAGKWWGALKPTQRATHAESMFSGIVRSVQTIRKDPGLNAEALTEVNRILVAANTEIQGLNDAIAKAKAEMAAEPS